MKKGRKDVRKEGKKGRKEERKEGEKGRKERGRKEGRDGKLIYH